MSVTRTRPPAAPDRGHLEDPGSRRRTASLLQSFNYAFEGIVWVLKTQRNMRIHFAVATGVLVAAFAYDVSKLELIALVLAIAFVLVAELVNTAVEAVTDLATSSFHPLAKLAKDISAGAVLVAAATAVVVGYLVLSERLGRQLDEVLVSLRDAPIHLTVIALAVVVLVVIAVKAATGRGTALRGGFPSGHAALAFAAWVAVIFLTEDFDHRVLVSSLVFLLALLVAQSRVEHGIHSPLEVVAGALLGASVSLVLFQALA